MFIVDVQTRAQLCLVETVSNIEAATDESNGETKYQMKRSCME